MAALSLPAQTDSDFTIVVLPDTQNYSEFYPQIFREQTEWIAAQRENLNIKLVVGVGDIVNDGSSDTQWRNADAAIEVLDVEGVPYLLAIGNHDYDGAKPSTRSAVLFNKYFGPARYDSAPYYSGSYPQGSNENFYGTMEINGQQYLLLAMEFSPRQAAVDWAADILNAHSDKQAIVFMHSYMYDDDSRVGRCDKNTAESFGLGADNDGDELWEKLISRHDNISLVLSGHIHVTDGAGRLSQLGVNGNLVNQILSDYQHRPEGGGGYLRIMRFRPSNNRIDVSTYSPHLDAYLTDSENQFSVPIRSSGENLGSSGTVVGRVRSTTCTSLGGATVSSGGTSVSTDSGGKFQLSVPKGLQSLTAEKSGYDGKSETAVVTPGFPAYRDFFLRQSVACSPDTSTFSAKICSPSDGASLNSPVRVLAASYSPNAITRTELWVDGVKRYQVYGDVIDTSVSMSAGAHRITVSAVETGGANYKQRVSVSVVDESAACAPIANSMNLCMPADQATVASPVRVLATAASSAGIAYSQVYVDGIKKYEILASNVDASIPMTVGTRRLTVQAKDKAGVFLKKTIFITVQ